MTAPVITISHRPGAVPNLGPRNGIGIWTAALLAMQRWLHGGALLGWPGRILVFLSGIAMPVLFVTGLAAWLLRRRNRRRIAVLQGKLA